MKIEEYTKTLNVLINLIEERKSSLFNTKIIIDEQFIDLQPTSQLELNAYIDKIYIFWQKYYKKSIEHYIQIYQKEIENSVYKSEYKKIKADFLSFSESYGSKKFNTCAKRIQELGYSDAILGNKYPEYYSLKNIFNEFAGLQEADSDKFGHTIAIYFGGRDLAVKKGALDSIDVERPFFSPKPTMKLEFNFQKTKGGITKSSLYQLFGILLKDRLIKNTTADVARFIKSNFVGMEHLEESTIADEINKFKLGKEIKKPSKYFEIKKF